MKALITGASGFVGSHLVEFLLNKNYDIIGLYNKNPLNNRNIHQYSCDINNYEDVNKIINTIKPDFIYHLAGPAFIPDSHNNPRETFNIIMNGTLNILEAIRRSSINSKLLYVGSSNEYGLFSEKELPLYEETPLNPITPYAASKASASLVCYQYHMFYDINVVRARPFNHIGPGQSPKFVCASFAKQIAMIEKGLQKPQIITGNLNIKRDFLDVRDVVNAYCSLMINDNAGEVYNICSGEPVLIKDILDRLISIKDIQEDIEIKCDDNMYRKFDFNTIYGSNQKLKQATGWEYRYTLEKTLEDTLEYWRGIV